MIFPDGMNLIDSLPLVKSDTWYLIIKYKMARESCEENIAVHQNMPIIYHEK